MKDKHFDREETSCRFAKGWLRRFYVICLSTMELVVFISAVPQRETTSVLPSSTSALHRCVGWTHAIRTHAARNPSFAREDFSTTAEKKLF